MCGYDSVALSNILEWCNTRAHDHAWYKIIQTVAAKVQHNSFCVYQRESNNLEPDKPDPILRSDRAVHGLCQSLLHCAHTRDASDPRDRVYGLHAVMTDVGLDLPEPDYGKTVADVFEGFIVSIIHRTKNLLALAAIAGISGHSPDRPSWVPDLTMEGKKMNWIPEKKLKDHPAFRPGFQLQHEPGRLTLEGVLLGTLDKVGSAPEPQTVRLEHYPTPLLREQFVQLIAVLWFSQIIPMTADQRTCPGGVAAAIAFYDAVLLSSLDFWQLAYDHRSGPPVNDSTTPWVALEYIMRVATAVFELQAHENLSRADAMLRILVTDPRCQPDGEWHSALRGIGRLCKGIHGKKPFALSNGCVGLGDGDFRVGDQVALLYGSAVPFVIRAVDGAQGGRGTLLPPCGASDCRGRVEGRLAFEGGR